MRGVLKATVLLLPLIAMWASGGHPAGLPAGLALAGLLTLMLRHRKRDPAIVLLQAVLLGVALAVSLASGADAQRLAAAVSIVAGLGLLATAFTARPWTADPLAGEWRGMTADPVYLAVNRLLSGIWGIAVAATGLALFGGAGAVLTWGPLLASFVLSIVLPGVMTRYLLARRLEPADPHPWPSPLVVRGVDGEGVLDAAVIGAGAGGLTAAALLARAGMKVAVFEQHDKPGGFCHSWQATATVDGEARTFRFDGGVHDVSSWHEGGTVRAVLTALGLETAIDWRRLDHRFVHDGASFQPPRGWDDYVEALAARFPGHRQPILALMADIRTIYRSMYATAEARGGVPGQPTSAEALIAYARAHPLAAEWVDRPFAQLLERHGVPDGARELLWGLSIYLTHRREALRVRDYVPLFSYFMFGGHYPAGGSGALTRALAESITRDGGSVTLGRKVERLLLPEGGGRVAGLRLADGSDVCCRAAILNGDLIRFLRDMLPEGAFPAQERQKLLSLSPANSGFLVYLAIRGEVPDMPPITHLRHDGIDQEVIVTTLADPSAAPEGFQTVELLRLVDPEEAARWLAFAPDHQSRKEAEARRMIAAAETLIPGLSGRIVFRSIAAPPAFQRYGGSSGGSIYALDAPFGTVPRRSPLPGLVFAGAMTRGPGVEGAVISGAEAADALLPGLLSRLGREAV